jgi:hypothetical protein
LDLIAEEANVNPIQIPDSRREGSETGLMVIVYILAYMHQTKKLFGGWRWKDVLEIGLSRFKPEMILMARPRR